jgi:hypothetical protein
MKYAIAAAAAFVLLSASTASAIPGEKQVIVLPVLDSGDAAFSAEDMTGPAQTNVFDVRGLDYVQIFASAASVTGTANVTIDCYTGPSSTDANYHIQAESIAAGVATQADYVPTHSVTTADKWLSIIPTKRASYMYCTFTCASGTMSATFIGGNY